MVQNMDGIEHFFFQKMFVQLDKLISLRNYASTSGLLTLPSLFVILAVWQIERLYFLTLFLDIDVLRPERGIYSEEIYCLLYIY